MLTQSMRPRWKVDTYSVPLSDGVYLRGNNNRLILKGKSLYALLEHLTPSLDGNITLEEITGGLDAERKRMVTNLIEKLCNRQFLQDASQDQPHKLRPLELETYASNIAFIGSWQTSAAYRFECFCHQRLLLIGSGPGLTSLVQASLQSGARKISALVEPENEACSSFRQSLLDLLASSASEQDTCLVDALSWDNEAEVRALIQGCDAVLHIAECPMLARAQLLNRLCIEQQKVCVQAVLVDDHAWIGPLVHPEAEACWECAWRRLQANLTDLARYEFRDQPASGSRPLALPAATLIAQRLVFELFRYVTQTSSTDRESKMSVVNLATLLSESHVFLPHPHCLACQHPLAPTAAQFLEHVQRLQRQAPIEPEMFAEKFSACVDEKLGLFTALDTDNFVQAPLAVYQAKLSNPMLKERPAQFLKIVAASIDVREACARAAQKAGECYSADFVDERRLFAPEAGQGEAQTWALDLQSQEVSAVPASRVFSASGEQVRGVASGKTWEEAISLALLDWCNYLTIEKLQDAQQAYPQVDLDRTPLAPEGEHLYRLLKAAGRQITVYDVTGSLGVPTFATCLDERVVAYTTHCDEMQALGMGLEQALRQYQSEQFQQPDYALAPAPDFPARLRGAQLSVPGHTLPGMWSARQAWLLQQLRAGGWRACAVPLDHDPALTRALPFIVRVILSERESEKGE